MGRVAVNKDFFEVLKDASEGGWRELEFCNRSTKFVGEESMFRKLSRKSRRKMILYTFVYYPLAVIIALLVAITVLKFIGLMKEVPVWYVTIMLIIGVGISIYHLTQMYKDLLSKEPGK